MSETLFSPLVKELDEDGINSEPDGHSPASWDSKDSFDESLPRRASDTAIKPLPKYENLKKEMEISYLRIRRFYRG